MLAYGSTQTDGYNGDGLRAWKQAGGAKTYFLYDGSAPVGEYSSTGTLSAANIFGADGLVSRRSASVGATVFYTFDERGSVVQRLSSSGIVIDPIDRGPGSPPPGKGAAAIGEVYDGFGVRTGTSAQTDPFGLEGQVGYSTDRKTGLILCTHLFYDPQARRFVTIMPRFQLTPVATCDFFQPNPHIPHCQPICQEQPVFGAIYLF